MRNVDFTYELLKEKPLPFKEIVDKLVSENNFHMNNIGSFYSDLTLDPRFVCLDNMVWDLSERQTYDKKHKEVQMIEDEIDEFDFDIE